MTTSVSWNNQPDLDLADRKTFQHPLIHAESFYSLLQQNKDQYPEHGTGHRLSRDEAIAQIAAASGIAPPSAEEAQAQMSAQRAQSIDAVFRSNGEVVAVRYSNSSTLTLNGAYSLGPMAADLPSGEFIDQMKSRFPDLEVLDFTKGQGPSDGQLMDYLYGRDEAYQNAMRAMFPGWRSDPLFDAQGGLRHGDGSADAIGHGTLGQANGGGFRPALHPDSIKALLQARDES